MNVLTILIRLMDQRTMKREKEKEEKGKKKKKSICVYTSGMESIYMIYDNYNDNDNDTFPPFLTKKKIYIYI